MFRRIFAATMLTLILAIPAIAIEAPLPRHPAPSPDGSQIAFSWQGNLWHPPSEDRSATEDTQLKRAVEVLLDSLETDPRTGAW